MKILKDTLYNTGMVLLGVFSLILLVGVVVWEGLKFTGKAIAWAIDMKIQQRYHKGE